MSVGETLAWTVARAGGLTAYVLLSLSVVLGLALSIRWQRPRWPRLITNDLHRFLTLLSLAFIVVHGLAVLLDPFMGFGWNEVLVPLMSHYRPLWIACGIVAGYLGLALWISSELRPYIGYVWWRRLHGLTFAVYVLTTVHGLATGSDTRTAWALALYGGSVAVVAALLCYRLLTPIGARARTYPNLAGLVALLVIGGALWTANGPVQAGWNRIANNGQGSGARVTTTTASTQAGAFANPFTAGVQGTLTRSTSAGGVTLQVDATLSSGATGTLQIVLSGSQGSDGAVTVTSSALKLAGPGGSPRYQGSLQTLQGDGSGWRFGAILSGSGGQPLAVQGNLSLASGGGVTGTLQGRPSGT